MDGSGQDRYAKNASFIALSFRLASLVKCVDYIFTMSGLLTHRVCSSIFGRYRFAHE